MNFLKLFVLITMHLAAHLAAGFSESSDWVPNACVWLYDSEYTWDANFRLLILKPNTSSLKSIDPCLSCKTFNIHTHYHAGFDVGVSRFFHLRNIKVSLNWQHFHSQDVSKESLPLFEKGRYAPQLRIKNKVKPKYDEVNLNGGICVNFGDYLQANFFVGINWAQIKQTLVSSLFCSKKDLLFECITPARFIGAGPQLGVEIIYSLLGNLNLVGHATASLLVGDLKHPVRFKSSTLTEKELNLKLPKVGLTHQVVPAFSGRLGFSYLYKACNRAISIEAGYEAKVFANDFQSHHFSLSGPYLKGKIDF